MSKNTVYEFMDSVFINELDNVRKLTVQEVIDKLRSVHEICKKSKDITNICFAYYDLYFTELINLNFSFRPETIEEFKKNKAIIRTNNSYAKLVSIFNDADNDSEPPKKKINLPDSNQYEKEWSGWIMKNQEFVSYFNPFYFEKLISQL